MNQSTQGTTQIEAKIASHPALYPLSMCCEHNCSIHASHQPLITDTNLFDTKSISKQWEVHRSPSKVLLKLRCTPLYANNPLAQLSRPVQCFKQPRRPYQSPEQPRRPNSPCQVTLPIFQATLVLFWETVSHCVCTCSVHGVEQEKTTLIGSNKQLQHKCLCTIPIYLLYLVSVVVLLKT